MATETFCDIKNLLGSYFGLLIQSLNMVRTIWGSFYSLVLRRGHSIKRETDKGMMGKECTPGPWTDHQYFKKTKQNNIMLASLNCFEVWLSIKFDFSLCAHTQAFSSCPESFIVAHLGRYWAELTSFLSLTTFITEKNSCPDIQKRCNTTKWHVIPLHCNHKSHTRTSA